MLKKIIVALAMAIILVVCLCGCEINDINVQGVWNIETISNESGQLIAVGETHAANIDLPRKNIICEIKADMTIIFIEDDLEYKGTYTIERISGTKLLHVAMANGKLIDVTCGEKKYTDGVVELSMIFEFENNIITFSKE